MVWSKIKKAINSTLGTSRFKPLDKIVEDSFSEVVARQNEFKEALETGENEYSVKTAENATNILLEQNDSRRNVSTITNVEEGIYFLTFRNKDTSKKYAYTSVIVISENTKNRRNYIYGSSTENGLYATYYVAENEIHAPSDYLFVDYSVIKTKPL